ncbi:MAG: sensor domain-containing diguanylate cyclase [Chloroflexi bacterium]|nr:sensor domain-containing diguanylate cyclase [Chloroflexota bacterium]
MEAIAHVTWASAAGIFFYESDLDHLIYAADSGFPEPLKKAMSHLAVEDFPHKRVVREGIAEFAEDIRSAPVFGTTRMPELQPEWLSFVCVPLTEGQQIVGIMVLFSDDPYVFDDEDLRLFERVGGQLGRAISNAQVHERVRKQAITDGLTGAYNRHYLDDFLEIEVKRCQRYKRPMSIMLLDMDHFKQCNETSGHQAGDQALRDVVHLLNLGVRSVDMVARYGGEEFLVVMPETGEKGAAEAAERVRSLIEQHQFPCGKLTASIGIVSCHYEDGDEANFDELVGRADRALFRAKLAGRNQVQVWAKGQEEQ